MELVRLGPPHPLTRFYDDGRLELDNNASERELRRVAVGRKAWMFVGSDDHAQAAGTLMTLIASARLHRLDPEAYLRDLIRVLPHWPRERFLELAPRDWLFTALASTPQSSSARWGRSVFRRPRPSSRLRAERFVVTHPGCHHAPDPGRRGSCSGYG